MSLAALREATDLIKGGGVRQLHLLQLLAELFGLLGQLIAFFLCFLKSLLFTLYFPVMLALHMIQFLQETRKHCFTLRWTKIGNLC